MRITIEDLRNLFVKDTRFFICNFNKENSFEISNTLFGTIAFYKMELTIRSVSAQQKDSVLIETDMPAEVLEAWKKYQEV